MTATATVTTQKPRRNSWWKQLWVWVLVGMALGIALGMAVYDFAAQMGPLGDAFIKLIRMLIAPIIFCTVVTGIAHMADMARIGRVAIKAIIYFEVTTTIALIIGLLAVNIMQPGAGMNVDVSKLNPSVVEPYVKLTHEVGFIPFLMNIIPNYHAAWLCGGMAVAGARAAAGEATDHGLPARSDSFGRDPTNRRLCPTSA